MQIEKRISPKPDNSVKLGNLKGGDVFHFATDAFEEVLKCDLAYMVVSGGSDGRVQIANIENGLLLKRDECHKVIKLNTSLVLDA